MGVLDGETVYGSLAPGGLPGPVRERLAALAAANWPSPWREALTLALYNRTVFGTPIVHYEPKQLARGRAVVAGGRCARRDQRTGHTDYPAHAAMELRP